MHKIVYAHAPLSEDSGVQARFLLGPAGSGKTCRCLAEIRCALQASPAGPPLILLAPKQATFQLERQLLAGDEIGGFTRLQIFSFDRLAHFIFDHLNVAPPKLLSAEGRLMVLRALLRDHADELKLFRGSARRPGFARELGALLEELQQHRFSPARLRALSGESHLVRVLRDKLHDLALLAEQYAVWLQAHELQDASHLLDFATAALRQDFNRPSRIFQCARLWLDGFAEMTPQEMALLAAVVPYCDQATLAFCLETEPTSETSWLSIWSAIGQTFQQCRAQIANLPDCEVVIDTLPRAPGKNRFSQNPTLQYLEESWSLPVLDPDSLPNPDSIRVIACADPEAEADFAAREVLKFVRSGRRYRDCAVLVRQLDDYHRPLARAFRRYGLPFFLDRRESVAHHPLAELTRSALRAVAFDWQPEDWFAVLKSGFSPVAEPALDQLENVALASGWRGRKWLNPLPDAPSEQLRQLVLPPFARFLTAFEQVHFHPTGTQLAAALRDLWADLNVPSVLEGWSFAAEQAAYRPASPAMHASVWAQMNLWLDNVVLAFPRAPLSLRDWLPVLEAGLANLTVGVIPPVLDEVLIGAIDRARNPSLKLALILGVNESVFPAAPAAPVILTNSDRDALELQNARLGASRFDQISRERYLGYIAFTRAHEKLVVTYARLGSGGQTLNPSPFIARLQRVFPPLVLEEFSGETDWRMAEHVSGLVPLCISLDKLNPILPGWREIPALNLLVEQLATLREPSESENLTPGLAEKLYGPVLKSSISRLEEFAGCPFRFFVRVGLRASERKRFELDIRERGNFQHEVLKIFHAEIMAAGKRWRDLEPAAARLRIRQIADEQIEHFHAGLLRESAETVFAARTMSAALQDFIEMIITWNREQYEFDPVAAELGFGGKDDPAPAWKMDLGDGRWLALQGRIDRLDLCPDPAFGTTLAVVMDYKSGGKKLESLLVQNGIQMQLLAYLGALRHWKPDVALWGAKPVVPAGAFYVNLQGRFASGDNRDEILGDAGAKPLAYRHNGRFDADHLSKFDRRGVAKGDQFNFRLNLSGGLPSNSTEAIPGKEFAQLIDQVEKQLQTLAHKIFSGAAAVDPYRLGAQTPCGFCDYRAACRIDPWTHAWRVLRAGDKHAEK